MKLQKTLSANKIPIKKRRYCKLKNLLLKTRLNPDSQGINKGMPATHILIFILISLSDDTLLTQTIKIILRHGCSSLVYYIE